MAPFTRVPFWVPILDPHPYEGLISWIFFFFRMSKGKRKANPGSFWDSIRVFCEAEQSACFSSSSFSAYLHPINGCRGVAGEISCKFKWNCPKKVLDPPKRGLLRSEKPSDLEWRVRTLKFEAPFTPTTLDTRNVPRRLLGALGQICP